jgi:insulysin
MKEEDLSTFPEKSLVVQKYDPENLKEFLGQLTPQNAFITILALPEVSGVKPDKKEKWLNIPYTVVDIPKDTFEQWEHVRPIEAITLPEPNKFIPDQIKMVVKEGKEDQEQKTLIPQPKAIVDNAQGKLYYAPDDRFYAPEVSLGWIIRSPEIEAGSRKVILADLYIKSLQDGLNEIAYPAKIANLDYKIERKDEWLQFSINGYSEKAPELFQDIMSHLKTVPSYERFAIIKESLKNEYLNKSTHAKPFEKSIEVLKGVIYEGFVSDKFKYNTIDHITYDDLKKYYENLFKQTYSEGVMFGNLTEEQAKKMWDSLNSELGSTNYHKENWNTQKVAILPNDQGPFYIMKDVSSRGNVTLLAVEYDRYSPLDRAAHQILSQAIEPAFFAELRTKQQTGYMVFNTNQEIERRLFLFFVSESYTYDTRDLLSRFELFLEQFLHKLKEDKSFAETFDTVKSSVINELSTPPRNTKDMGEMLQTLAFKYDGDFMWIQKRIEGAQTLDFNTFVDKANAIIGRENRRRLAVMIQGQVVEKNLLQYVKAKNLEWLRGELNYVSREQFLKGNDKGAETKE